MLSYGLIVAFTIPFAKPPSLSTNEIGAKILVLPGDFVVGNYFIIHNETNVHWKSVTFEIDQGYKVYRDLVQAGEKVTLYVKDFKKKVVRTRRGKKIPKTISAPIDLPLSELRIECSEGLVVEPLADKLPVDEGSG